MSTLAEFIECSGCGFVLIAESTEKTEPKRVDSCPDCGGTAFEFTGT